MCTLPILLEKERDQLLQSPPSRARGCPVRQGHRSHVPRETSMPTPEPLPWLWIPALAPLSMTITRPCPRIPVGIQ